jgi:hypothetical protein
MRCGYIIDLRSVLVTSRTDFLNIHRDQTSAVDYHDRDRRITGSFAFRSVRPES